MEYKKHDIFRILLSFYLYLDNDINAKLPDGLAEGNRKDDIRIVLLQINRHLYEYKIKKLFTSSRLY